MSHLQSKIYEQNEVPIAQTSTIGVTMPQFRSNVIPFTVYHYPDPSNPGEHISRWLPRERPIITCLCGSTKFMKQFYEENTRESLSGKIVLSIAASPKGDCNPTKEEKILLDDLHKRKIDLADEVLVLNVGGYVGESTKSEIEYAIVRNKIIRWLEPDKLPEWLLRQADKKTV